jgi:proline dehydrogenase
MRNLLAPIAMPILRMATAQSDLTFELLARLEPTGLGCAIPGRWRRSLEDAEHAIELGVRVRVVKGQWPDPQQPDIDLRDGFLAVIDALAGRAASVGIATHDLPLAREARQAGDLQHRSGLAVHM